MANAIYDTFGGKIATAAVIWNLHDIRAVLVSSTYSFSAGHEFLSSVTGILSTASIDNCTISADGVLDGDDVAFTGVTGTGDAVVIYRHTGSSATSSLIAYIDMASGLPTSALVAGTVTVTWDAGGILDVG